MEDPPFARCHTCAMFTARVRNAVSDAERQPLMKAQQQHIEQVMSHRSICSRLNLLSEEGKCLKVDLDGADQSKALVPRNLDSSKVLSACWRPQYSIFGTLCHGATFQH